MTVPDEPPDQTKDGDSMPSKSIESTPHTQIQVELARLGYELGMDVWVARNDRGKSHNGHRLDDLPGLVEALPTQFNEATNRTIELIDVLWLKGRSVVAAFEIECTAAVYSGILRMGDLLSLQPNLEINLFLVAPEERRNKVESEILRPTFRLMDKPMNTVCGFIGIETLRNKLAAIRDLGLASSLKADFVQEIAEYFSDEEDV